MGKKEERVDPFSLSINKGEKGEKEDLRSCRRWKRRKVLSR